MEKKKAVLKRAVEKPKGNGINDGQEERVVFMPEAFGRL